MNFMESVSKLENRVTRSVCPENITGGKGCGGMTPLEEGSAKFAASDLGLGWKTNPYYVVQPGETLTLADIQGEGTIDHMWFTPTGRWRYSILRIYWDDQEQPSVECPIGDFFGMGWQEYAPLNSLAVCVNPGSAFNCYWSMPFKKRCRMTLENIDKTSMVIYYQIDYSLHQLEEEIAYFHAQFRRVNPLPAKEVYTILDGVKGRGRYVGTYMAWGSNSNGWWGEGEIKFYLDGDKQFPTICGTGTEDYFCGSYNFENLRIHQYETFSTAYAGLHQVLRPDGLYRSQMRFGMYRWHLTDPICFEEDLKVTIQALGWRDNDTYLPLKDDIASVAFWYQTLPTVNFPELPAKSELEVN